jgi:hypothetical protein
MSILLDKTSKVGIEYHKTGYTARGRVQRYHYKPSPIRLSSTAHEVDIQSINNKKRTEVLLTNRNFAGQVVAETKFTIGFEIEKTSLHRGAVKEYELFCGFELDSSCGYEAVTHILPLVPNCMWRMKVYDMMHKASKIIEDTYSPSNHSCGGHITLGVQNQTGAEILEKIRPYMGLFYALFRYRLKNAYCKFNPRLLPNSELSPYASDFTLIDHSKYKVALAKYQVLELRLPSRVSSVKQLMRRYELCYEMLDTAYNKPRTSFKSFLNKVKPILMRAYDYDDGSVDNIIGYAIAFQDYINKGKVKDSIEQFLPSQSI